MRRVLGLPEAPPRLIKIDGRSLGIITYDADNGYPQRMNTLINASSTAKQCVEMEAEYVFGQGFSQIEGLSENLQFYKQPINDKKLTPEILLDRLIHDRAKFRGFAFHVNYNALYEIVGIWFVPFETTRLGVEENKGKICLYDNWYNTDTFGRYRRKDDVIVIDRYNSDPEVIEEQVSRAGGWDKYKGQIYWHSDDYESYPLSSIDSVLESVIAEIESDKTTTNNLKNNFQLKTIWGEKGKFEDDNEKEEFVQNVQKFIGSEGKPVIVVELQDPDGSDMPIINTVPTTMNDKVFAYTDEKVRAKIYRSFRQPAILHSDYMGTNGYNRDQLRDSMEYYTNYTHPKRISFEEIFREIFDRFYIDINPQKVYDIVPLANLTSEASSNGNTTTNI